MQKGIAFVYKGRIEYAGEMRVAFNGTVYAPTRIVVACGGTAREVWPIGPGDPIIGVMGTDTKLAIDTVSEPGLATAYWKYLNPSGRVEWSNTPAPNVNGTGSETAITPPPYQSGQWIMRMVPVSGSISGPLGWRDALTQPEWTVSNNIPGTTNTAQGQFSIARDNGAGAPLVSTLISRTVNFRAEVVGSTGNPGFQFSSNPWVLEDITTEKVAETSIEVFLDPYNSIGTVKGFEGISGTPNRKKYDEVYAQPATQGEQVRLSLISGDTGQITGSPTDTWLPLSFVTGDLGHEWELEADTAGEDYSAEVRLEFNDSFGNIVSKAVSLRSAREDTAPEPTDAIDWDGKDYYGDDIGAFATPPQLRFTVRSDGTVSYQSFVLGPSGTTGPDFLWHDDAPNLTNPQNYLVRLRVLSGIAPTSGPAIATWLSMSVQRAWDATIPVGPLQAARAYTWAIDIKRVGAPDGDAETATVQGTLQPEGGQIE